METELQKFAPGDRVVVKERTETRWAFNHNGKPANESLILMPTHRLIIEYIHDTGQDGPLCYVKVDSMWSKPVVAVREGSLRPFLHA